MQDEVQYKAWEFPQALEGVPVYVVWDGNFISVKSYQARRHDEAIDTAKAGNSCRKHRW